MENFNNVATQTLFTISDSIVKTINEHLGADKDILWNTNDFVSTKDAIILKSSGIKEIDDFILRICIDIVRLKGSSNSPILDLRWAEPHIDWYDDQKLYKLNSLKEHYGQYLNMIFNDFSILEAVNDYNNKEISLQELTDKLEGNLSSIKDNSASKIGNKNAESCYKCMLADLYARGLEEAYNYCKANVEGFNLSLNYFKKAGAWKKYFVKDDTVYLQSDDEVFDRLYDDSIFDLDDDALEAAYSIPVVKHTVKTEKGKYRYADKTFNRLQEAYDYLKENVEGFNMAFSTFQRKKWKEYIAK